MLRLATDTGSGGFHGPSIADFFPTPIWFGGTFAEFNRIMLVRVVIAVVLVALLMLAARNAKVVPSRGQSIVEMIFAFVRTTIVDAVLGEKDGRKYAPMLTIMFVSLVAFNFTEIIPGLNIPSTGIIAMPMLLALTVLIVYIHAGVRRHGAVKYAKLSLFPAGVPLVLKPLIAVVDGLQTLVIRPGALTIRLMINMIVGHLLLALSYAATDYFWVTAANGFNYGYGALTFVGSIFMTTLEIFVTILQAFIFTILSAVYINMALAEEH
ncbi:F0F1 ATP synthase subunit A [Demequina lutea]|uniref:ATP synthase subunit a n=1 Tax=Demequina lutea TaxID=431489 RepID=A0A7Z0CI39_9MICO|nr:F0F1 ATP synthase subunit A [Demequina lutea]NYI42151.1 F-type H+-transporting ATPase subunit a [Demequina lutea]